MNYIVPTKWSECNEYQLQRIAKSLFTAKKNVIDAVSMLKGLFINKKSIWQRMRFSWLMLNVPITELLPYLNFIQSNSEVYHFPKIKGLKKPSNYMASITIKQFSIADKLYFDFVKSKDLIKLRQLVASLYCIDSFDEEKLPEVATITDKQSEALWYRILLAYMSCRNYITNSYPKIFPPKEEIPKDVIVPVFKRSDENYTPFNEVIVALAFEDPQPLGNYAEAKKTKIYEFLNIFNNSIKIQEKIKQDAKRK